MSKNSDHLDRLIANPESFSVETPVDSGNGLSEEQYLEAFRRREHYRNHDWQEHFYKHFKWLFSALCIVFIVLIAILVAHWIIPESWQWLTNQQQDNLKNILLAVFASNAVGSWLNKIK